MGNGINTKPYYKIYRADGSVEMVEGNVNDLGLSGMQELVGGLIELVRFESVWVDAWEMIIDEEGLFKNGDPPELNETASNIAGVPIVGTAVVMFNHGLQ